MLSYYALRNLLHYRLGFPHYLLLHYAFIDTSLMNGAVFRSKQTREALFKASVRLLPSLHIQSQSDKNVYRVDLTLSILAILVGGHVVHAVGPVGGRAVGLGAWRGDRPATQAAVGGGRGEGVFALGLEGCAAGVQETHHLGRHTRMVPVVSHQQDSLALEGQLKVA